MSGTRGGGRARRWFIAVAVALLVAGVAVLTLSVGPPIVSAAMTRVAGADESVRLTSGSRTATVAVPAGWSVRPAFNDTSRVSLASPDGAMSVQLAVTSTTDATATAHAMAAGPWDLEVREPDGAGRELVHARTLARDAVAGFLDGGGGAVVFVSAPTPGYDAELARLLDGVEIAP